MCRQSVQGLAYLKGPGARGGFAGDRVEKAQWHVKAWGLKIVDFDPGDTEERGRTCFLYGRSRNEESSGDAETI